MATSNSTDFSVSTLDIITEALQMCGVPGEGDIQPADYESALRTLNLMVKAWQSSGLFLHTYRDATLFFDHNEAYYRLGSTAHATESYVETSLAADAVATDTTITLASIVSITDGDVLGVVLDDGTIQWTTVTTAANTLIADALTGDAASGNMVIAYTAAIGKPEKVTDVMRCTADGYESEIEIVSREAYRRIPDKNTGGKITKVAVDPKTSYMGLFVWPRADDVTDRLTFSYQKTVEDFDAVSNTPDIPGAFSEALVTGLAYRLAPKYRLPVSERQELQMRAENAKAEIDDFEETSIFVEPRMK